MSPLISVILPVFNAEKYLREAIDSILHQSITDFEFLIYDDGSTDASLSIIQSYQDPRIILKQFDQNIGLIELLNQAFKEAKGKYIARMDADDISLPNRFELQIQFLENNPEFGICGSQCQIIGTHKNLSKPTNDIDLRWWIFKGSPLAHPSIMLRTELFKQHHLEFKKHAYVVEDFDLWWRMAFHTKMANLPEVLLMYRMHEAQESSAKQQIQSENFRKSQLEFMGHLGMNTQIYDPIFMDNMLSRNTEANPDNILKIWKAFNGFITSKNALMFFGREAIERKWEEELVYYLQNLKQFHIKLLPLLFSSRFKSYLQLAQISILTFALKSIILWKTR